ncbi:MAG TPA: glycosyltransferase family 2 protein [Candidatus Nanoarchaeia archaeon]|nr:glycosyltransferase family 2 protein [Candidatus Nanoarchaeia archaeon]
MEKVIKVIIVIPAYNEEKKISSVINRLKNEGYDRIIVVDDGSSDRTYEMAKNEKVIVLRHIINRGLGGALNTGITAALEEGADIIITFDADGQHHPSDIKKLIKPILSGNADTVIGSRLLNPKGMPFTRRIGNWFFNVITYLFFRVWTTDSQSGLRAFSRKAARRINIRTNRMEVSSEIIKEIGANKLRFCEVPVKTIYTKYSLRKGQSILNGFRILGKLIIRKLMR